MNSSLMTSLLWFVAILAMIPAALWLLKRTPVGGAGSSALMKNIAVLPLSANQRIVTVEVGAGETRQWLVLGVTPASITTLHTMAPVDGMATPSTTSGPAFAGLLAKFHKPDGGPDAR